MTATSTDLIVKLREKTGAGMMDCKKALQEAQGDLEKAVEILRKKGVADAAKKSARTTKEGAVAGCVSGDGRSAALLELNCETDFVAKTADYQKLAADLAAQAAAGQVTKPEDAAAPIQAAIARLGENIALRRLQRFELSGPGLLAFYIHPTGRKAGALVELGAASEPAARSAETESLAKELLLQIVAASPRFVEASEIPQDVLATERDIYAVQLKNEGKPEAAIPKIVEGKIQKLLYQQFCLLEQVSIRDNKTPIHKLVEQAGARAGGALAVRRFVRYQVGGE